MHCWFTSEGSVSVTFKSSEIYLLVKTGCITQSVLFPRLFSCLRTELADFWSLKGKVVNTGLSIGSIQLWFRSWEVWNLIKMESISFTGYLQHSVEQFRGASGRSLTYKLNNKGPRMLPWGTPYSIGIGLETVGWVCTTWYLFVR